MFKEKSTEEIIKIIEEASKKIEELEKDEAQEKEKIEIQIELVGADEIIKKLQEIKKLIDDISKVKIEIK